MLALPQLAGFAIGEVRHRFEQVGSGTAYRVEAIIGSEVPLLGSLLNRVLRQRVFHPRMMQQWQRHQVEEVASLQFFLPQIYAQRAAGSHFLLE